jgi:hypothetical protein
MISMEEYALGKGYFQNLLAGMRETAAPQATGDLYRPSIGGIQLQDQKECARGRQGTDERDTNYRAVAGGWTLNSSGWSKDRR